MKNKKKRNKKYKQKYTTKDRLDMSKGGRVSLVDGGISKTKPEEEEARDSSISIGGIGGGDVQPATSITNEDEPVVIDELPDDTTTGTGTDTGTTTSSQMTKTTTASPERTERISETASQVQEGAKGTVPQAAVIPGVSEEAGTAVKEEIPQAVTTMVEPTEAKAEEAKLVTPETVTTAEVKEAQTPEQIEAAQMEAEKVTPEVTVEAEEGVVSDDQHTYPASLG